MASTYLSYNNIISPLGFDSESVFNNVKQGMDGIINIDDSSIIKDSFYAARIDTSLLNEAFTANHKDRDYTRLEKMMILSLDDVITKANVDLGSKTILVISTTKGNVDCLQKNSSINKKKAYLSVLAKNLGDYFGFKNTPLVVSNACVSGLTGISVARRLIDEGIYKQAFVIGGDILSRFILSGFKSFQAISSNKCKPYSKNRDGISIGEAAASVFVTQDYNLISDESVKILGDATANDANHISGPSRTGEGLYRAVIEAMGQADLEAKDLDYISAHGTATIFNDEMEAVAFNRLNMQHIPLNSLKGYFGHTMGACGIVETIVGMYMLSNNILIRSKGYDEIGVSKPMNIINQNSIKDLTTFLKTSSGFGGSNTAVIYSKVTNPDM